MASTRARTASDTGCPRITQWSPRAMPNGDPRSPGRSASVAPGRWPRTHRGSVARSPDRARQRHPRSTIGMLHGRMVVGACQRHIPPRTDVADARASRAPKTPKSSGRARAADGSSGSRSGVRLSFGSGGTDVTIDGLRRTGCERGSSRSCPPPGARRGAAA